MSRTNYNCHAEIKTNNILYSNTKLEHDTFLNNDKIIKHRKNPRTGKPIEST